MTEKQTVVINRTTYEVLSASVESYSFIGTRFYHPFHHLVYEPDLTEFCEQLRVCSKEYFAVRLLDEQNQPILHIASAAPSANPQAAVVTFLSAAKLAPELERQSRVIEMKNYILSVYGDEFFEYSAETDLIRMYRLDKYEQTIAEVPLQTFFDHMRRHVQPSDELALSQFCSDFRSQKTMLVLKAKGHLLEDRDASLTLIKGISLFEQGSYKGAAGIIHIGAKRGIMAAMERDSLTGLLPKAEITSTAINMIDVQKRQDLNILIVDVDHFKLVNDTFGHMTGDAVLKRVASILVDEVAENGLVGRIGGDEFMVLYFGTDNMEKNRDLLRSIRNRVAAIYPGGDETQPRVTLSIGCAAYPKDADCYEDVFRLADFAMYRAKHKGRNRYVIFDAAKHGTLTEILKTTMSARRINNRGDMSVGDMMCTIMSQVFNGEGGPIETLMEEAAVDLGLQRVMLYAGTPWQVVCMAGDQRLSERVVNETIGYLDAPELMDIYDEHGVMVCDDIEKIAAQALPFYDQMKQQGILSCIHIKGTDADGVPFLLSIEAVHSRVTWNPELVKYYALFQQVIHTYHLTR